MIVVSTSNITKSYGTRDVLKDITFAVNAGEHVGVIGSNGAGKSTLFSIITGESKADSGQVHTARNIRLGYMRQNAEYTSGRTAIEEVMQVLAHISALERRLEGAESDMRENPSEENIKRHHELHERFIEQGGLTYKARARSTLVGLGFAEDELDLPLNAISGGQRTRVLLAGLLLGQNDVLILDEPTNHLDIKATVWLEEFLRGYKGAFFVVSHDRYFLDRVTNVTFDMEGGTLSRYTGNYSMCVEKKRKLREAQQKEYEGKLAKIDKLEGIITQQKQWNREKNLVTARSKGKAIERIQATLVKPPSEERAIEFSFPPTPQSGQDVLIAKGLGKSYQKRLFENADMHIMCAERAFLLGANGCGKTTLFRILTKKVTEHEGNFELGSRVKVGYYDQAASDISSDKTILDYLTQSLPMCSTGILRNALAAFLFKGDDVFKKVDVLSGGEKARVALCRLMLEGGNFLLLDEPTNHLDIKSKEALEGALSGYTGTLFVISHDRYFINKLAEKIYFLDERGITLYPGNYEYYVEHMNKIAEEQKPKEKPVQNDYKQKKAKQSEINRAKGRLSRLEKDIETAEECIENLQAELEEHASDYERIAEITGKIAQSEQLLSGYMDEWEALSLLLEQDDNCS